MDLRVGIRLPTPNARAPRSWLTLPITCYHGTGNARGERACKHCKQGESSKSSKNSESRSAKTTKKSKARVARAPRRSRQQARMIAYALARPLRGLAGRFELGTSPSHRSLELLNVFRGSVPRTCLRFPPRASPASEKRAARIKMSFSLK